MTEEVAHPIVRSSIPIREFEDLREVTAVAVFPDRRRMATNSSDGMVRMWDLKSGVMLMELEGRGLAVRGMALSRDGKLMASTDDEGYVLTYHGDTGRPLAPAFKAHSAGSYLLDFSPDGSTLATGSDTVQLWCTATWQSQGTIDCGRDVTCQCIRYSPFSKLLAVVASYQAQVSSGYCISIQTHCRIYICNPATKECIANIEQTVSSISLVWMPDGTRLLSDNGSTIREWDSSTWKETGGVWKGDTESSRSLAVNYDGTVVASLTTNNHVRLWWHSDRRTIAIFQHSGFPSCVTFSADGKHILVGCKDKKISQWAVPEHAWPKDTPKDRVISQGQHFDTNAQVSANDSYPHGFGAEDQGSETEILVMNTAVRNACISGELTNAEELLTQDIDVNGNNYRSYANRSVVMARKLDWDSALDDATKSLSIQHSLMGYISKGIALCGKTRVQNAKNAFDLASTFIDGDSKAYHTLFLIKSIALFGANQHTEAVERVLGLAATRPNVDTTLACRTVEVYFHIQLGNNAMDRARPSQAADHFTAAVNAGTSLPKSAIHSNYEEFVVLFGCDFTSLWQTANQKRCRALLQAGKLAEVFEACRYMADMSDESTKASCLDWTIGFMQEMSTFRGNTPTAEATPEIMMRQYDDEEEKDSFSDIDSDIDHIEDVVC